MVILERVNIYLLRGELFAAVYLVNVSAVVNKGNKVAG